MKIQTILAATILIQSVGFAEAVKDREGAVRSDRAKMEKQDRWIYNDIDAGFAQAKKSGKPVLVALRCVPCKGCMGIDQSILTSDELQPLLDQFVCVRIINANALDLSKFQFDFDLSFSTIFFNADGTIYGRFGSWQHQKDEADVSTAGYKATMLEAIKVHKGYPANKASLEEKQGGPTPFKTPIEIPPLAGKYQRELNWDGKVVQSCVHCHMIGDAYRSWYRDAGKPIPVQFIYPMPAPETVGLRFDSKESSEVFDVTPGSPAAAAGLLPRDRIASVNGQPIISIADFAWVLHRAPDQAALKIVAIRKDKPVESTLLLASGWRGKADISARHSIWSMRAMVFGGMNMADMTDEERQAAKLPLDTMALRVKGAGANFGPYGTAMKTGFKKDDIIVSVDGNTKRTTESALVGPLLNGHAVKEKVKFIVQRGADRIELMLPMQ